MSYALPGILGLDCAILTNLNRVKSTKLDPLDAARIILLLAFVAIAVGFLATGTWKSSRSNWKFNNLF